MPPDSSIGKRAMEGRHNWIAIAKWVGAAIATLVVVGGIAFWAIAWLLSHRD